MVVTSTSTWEVLSLQMVAECNIVTHFMIDSASLTQSTILNQSLLHLTINYQGQGLCLHSDTYVLLHPLNWKALQGADDCWEFSSCTYLPLLPDWPSSTNNKRQSWVLQILHKSIQCYSPLKLLLKRRPSMHYRDQAHWNPNLYCIGQNFQAICFGFKRSRLLIVLFVRNKANGTTKIQHNYQAKCDNIRNSEQH